MARARLIILGAFLWCLRGFLRMATGCGRRKRSETWKSTGDGRGDNRYRIDDGGRPASRLHYEPIDDHERRM